MYHLFCIMRMNFFLPFLLPFFHHFLSVMCANNQNNCLKTILFHLFRSGRQIRVKEYVTVNGFRLFSNPFTFKAKI